MARYKINKPIAALYATIAAGIMGPGGAIAWQEMEDTRLRAELWTEIESLMPATQALEDSGILPPQPTRHVDEGVIRRIQEQNGIIPPAWSVKQFLRTAQEKPEDIDRACLVLDEMTLMHRFYLLSVDKPYDAAATPMPVAITPEYKETVETMSTAEKKLCYPLHFR